MSRKKDMELGLRGKDMELGQRGKDMELGLSDAELFLADALSDGWDDEEAGSDKFGGSDNTDTPQEPTPTPTPPPYVTAPPLKESIYLAMRVEGGRIEIEGEPTDYLLGVAEWVLEDFRERLELKLKDKKENSND